MPESSAKFIRAGFKGIAGIPVRLIKKLKNRNSGSSQPHAASEIPSRLTAFSESLKATSRSVEPEFMTIGRSLQSVYADTKALTQQAVDTVNRFGGKDEESELGRIERLIRESLENLNRCREDVTVNLKQVDAVAEYLSELHDKCSVVEKIAVFLKVVGLNIGIESTRSEESKEMFTVIGQEIQQLSNKVMDITRNIREDSSEAGIRQRSAHGEIAKSLNTLKKLSDDVEVAVYRAVREIKQLMELSFETLEQAGENSRRISRQIGEIVVGIQFHDSMNQRIDHIIQSLAEIDSLLSEDSFREFGKKERLGIAHSILAVQEAQLREVITEIAGVDAKSRQAFRQIGDEVDKLAQGLSALGLRNPVNERGSSEKDPFLSLESAVQHLNDLLGDGTELMDRIRNIASQASDTAYRLFDHMKHVREINFETHIKALNAIVNAAHLGEKGRTLEVLAQEMKGLSSQSNVFVQSVEKILESISGSVEELRSRILDTGIDADFLDSGMRDISSSYVQFETDSRNTFQRSEDLKSAISQTSAYLDFFPRLAGELENHLHELEEMSGPLKALASKSNDSSGDMENLIHRYTMQKERAIHNSIVEAPKKTALPQTESIEWFEPVLGTTSAEELSEGEDHEDDDLGDNVELF